MLPIRREISSSSYYRRRPFATAQLLYARWRLSRGQPDPADPTNFLRELGVEPADAMQGYEGWSGHLHDVVHLSEEVDDALGVTLADGIVLYGLVRALRPEFVVETGIATGVSTSFISAALIENGAGRLYSIDLPPQDAASRVYPDGSRSSAFGPGWAVPDEICSAIGNRHEVILEDVRTALPALLFRLPQIDLFFHDDLHLPSHMLWEYRTVWPRLAHGGVLASDDINYGWLRFCRTLSMGKHSYFNLERLGVIIKP
jgi:hypothetical protein